MTYKFRYFKAINITVSFLFFAFLIVGYIFVCSDTEYNLNQQMARGYITSDAVFFDFDNPAIKPYGYGADVTYSDGRNDKTALQQKEYDPDFILRNKVLDDGVTSVEKLLTSSDSDYFAALHMNTMRAVCYKGKLSLPPVVSGRFFTEEECLSDKNYAVVGKNFEKEIYKEGDKSYYNFLGRKYEIIGITGIASKSAMDSIIFVNLGSLMPEEQLNGIYYIDCSRDNKAVYEDIAKNSRVLFGCNLKSRKTPIAFIDIASGKMYMKNYLFVIIVSLMIFAYANTLIQYIERQQLKISIMKLCGAKIGKILKEAGIEYIIDCMTGILTGVLTLFLLLYYGVFALEYSYVVNVILGLSGASLGFAIVGFFIFSLFVVKADPQEIIRQV